MLWARRGLIASLLVLAMVVLYDFIMTVVHKSSEEEGSDDAGGGGGDDRRGEGGEGKED
jgi:hypothetical protein